MQAGKRYTLFQTVRWTSRHLLIFLIIDTIVVTAYYFLRADIMVIPWQPISLIGIAVAFYLGFKNNSSYERLWEARKIWGGIVNSSRSYTVMVRDFITNEFADENRSEGELHRIHKTIVHRHVAWLYALTFQLRNLTEWEHDTSFDQSFRDMLGLRVATKDLTLFETISARPSLIT
jgi:putative membrane protein